MEWIADKVEIKEYIKRYRCIFLVVLLGICLMLIPENESAESVKETEQQTTPEETDLEDSLSQLLSKISGAGNVQVLLTKERGMYVHYQYDENSDGTETKRDTVLITGNDRSETGLVQNTEFPIYRGAIVLCQGADNAQIRLSIVEAVKNATGLSSDRISVLKMK